MENNNLIHRLDKNSEKTGVSYGAFFVFVAISVILGTILGFLITKLTKTKTITIAQKSEKAVGVVDKKTFKDKAEGILREGGIDGEGNFHLERPGGESQNVYLTSTTVDLSLYVGKKVRVWGKTFSGEKAGWLMDVGLVEILK
ncbi:MAG: hypothetical protein KatS3mg092_0163 [Patescibacteria group bacterium]|nr:MAG: hypothetical protein KatS3mg092_0163 [Patescibacteria group bacterium]